ncbi:hypothetical protein BJX68DRAFT_248700 [Aspergillus pseudodeflectus]|uniref:Uncharacterized protein n=1 Tax=Aspergillus pseudodeflectus TaxID=176178 RepID=A0ABR4JF72_9EURO
MPPKRAKKDDKPPAPSVWSPNPFSLLDSAPQRLTETPTRPSSPRVSTRPSTPQELHDIVLEIPLELATVQSRLQTFHQWPLAHITPRQLARLGFWHAPSGKDRDSVSCFACDVSVQRWRDVEHTTAELLALHDDHCVWADLLEDMETFPNLPSYEPTGQLPRTSTIETKTEPLSSSSSIQPRHPTTESQEPPQAQEPLQPQVPSNPTPSSRKSYASILKTPLNPPTRLKAKLTSASQSPGPAAPETPTTTTCRYPSTLSPTRSPIQSPTLTVDDLYSHFHNKPSPFTSADSNNHYFAISQHKLVSTATNALSNFLLSALPAFTGYLSNMQIGGSDCRPPYTWKVSRRERGNSQPKFSKRQWSTPGRTDSS